MHASMTEQLELSRPLEDFMSGLDSSQSVTDYASFHADKMHVHSHPEDAPHADTPEPTDDGSEHAGDDESA
jgi:hypothetical protein